MTNNEVMRSGVGGLLVSIVAYYLMIRVWVPLTTFLWY